MADLELLRRIDAYLDAAPRTACRTEAIGPFTLFVNDGSGWRYYARATPGARAFTPEDVTRLRERQRELGLPEAIEWVNDLAPDLGAAAEAGGMQVIGHPLLVLPSAEAFAPVPVPTGAEVRMVGVEDDLARIGAVAEIAFGNPGTGIGTAGTEDLGAMAREADPAVLGFVRDRVARGVTIQAAAFVDGEPVATGAHQPVGDATEIVGVACLPAFRRRGLGAAVTSLLVRDALARGVTTVCMSADDADVERLYSRLGFVTVGTVGAAEPRRS
jgi:ribosomal protein S18 acetylase RimI-like enzyme